MSTTRELEYQGLNVSIGYDSSSDRVTRKISENGTEIYQDELTFDKSVAANFELMSAEDQAEFVTAWGAAGIKSWIEDGRFGSRQSY